MSNFIKNFIVFLGGLATIGCVIVINSYEEQNKLYVKEVGLEVKLYNLEQKNNELLLKIEKLSDELTIIKKILLNKKILIDQQKILLEQINDSLQKNITNQDNQNNQDNLEIIINQEKSEFNNKIEDAELLDECYDSLPLNNLKKVSGIKSWFY